MRQARFSLINFCVYAFVFVLVVFAAAVFSRTEPFNSVVRAACPADWCVSGTYGGQQNYNMEFTKTAEGFDVEGDLDGVPFSESWEGALPPGPPGPAGPKGDKGNKGDKGDKGDPGPTTTHSLVNCSWTGYINIWDGYFSWRCPSPKILTGVSSYHDDHYEDRRFRFYCCEMRN